MAGVAVIVKLSTQLLTAAVSLVETGPTVVNVSKSRRIEQILVGSEKKMLISSKKNILHKYFYYLYKIPVEHLLMVYVTAALPAKAVGNPGF